MTMKTLLLLLSLSAVAVGQRTAKVYPLPCNVLDIESYVDSGGQAIYECVHFVKPHKRKPPVKTFPGDSWGGPLGPLKITRVPDPRDGQCFGCDGKKRPEIFHITAPAGDYTIQCEGVCGKGPLVSSKDVLPCDGISCVGPVEMMPGKCESCSSLDTDSRTCKPVKCPDKAAVPVAPDVAQLYTFTAVSSPTFTIMSQNADCSWQGFQYDPLTKTCSIRITFDVSSQVVCTPLLLNEQGKPEMTCSFKVIDKGGG